MHKKRISLLLLTLVVGVMAACGNESRELDAKPTAESAENNVNQGDVSSTDDSTEDSSATEGQRTEYLKKLNDTKKELDEVEAKDSSTYALKAVENERWENWDELLNEIYGVLKEQLLPDEMEQLREEQRDWIKFRDERALESSLQYKGGTMEQLEYVIVLANLTEERCFELVENYMK